ncbi:MAG: NMT1-like family protein [Deltaproteobacteria bacterium]|jgi:NitT/TauT family transport system substrate-binding protein|nr:NMT1-like family protein [Deltaproteobacteria bacterium]
MKFALLLLCILCFPIRGVAADAIRIAYPSTSFTTVPIVAAIKHGHFQQEGIRAELIFMRPNISVTALVNGQVEFATVHGSVVRAAARGLPVKSLMVIADRPAYFLVTRAMVQSIPALKGKTIGIASLGGSVHLMTKELFAQSGLDPDRDVSMVVTGDHNTSILAMQAGNVDAIVIAVPWQTVAAKAGFHNLTYLGDALRLPMAGLGAADESMKKRPDLLKRAVKSTLRAIDFVRDRSNKSEVLALMGDWFKISDDLAQNAYDQMVQAYPANGMVSDQALEKDLEIARQTGAIKGRVPLSRIVDFQFVREARQELSGEKQ